MQTKYFFAALSLVKNPHFTPVGNPAPPRPRSPEFLKPTSDGRISIQKMECLGACEIAPCLRLNNEFVGNVDLNAAISKIDELP